MTSSLTLLYCAAGVAAISAIAYELLLASYATFLLGGSVFQYALIFATMMASMGVGASLTGRVKKAHLWFFAIEMVLGLAATVAIPLLYFSFARNWHPEFWVFFFSILMGIGIGMEIPLINRMQESLGKISQVLFFDYFGGFLGGLLFPLWLLPQWGFFRSAALMGMLNLFMACTFGIAFRRHLPKPVWLVGFAVLALGWSAAYLWNAEIIRVAMEASLFGVRPI